MRALEVARAQREHFVIVAQDRGDDEHRPCLDGREHYEFRHALARGVDKRLRRSDVLGRHLLAVKAEGVAGCIWRDRQ